MDSEKSNGGRGPKTAQNKLPLVRMENISKSFTTNGTTVSVLDSLCVDIHEGETIAVVGESGIGKTTFLHVLGTLEHPDTGRVILAGADVTAMQETALAAFRNRFLGFVFQFHYLLSEFSALENVMMPGLISGMKRAEIKDAAESILVRMGLKDRLSNRVTDLSGGEQQRVALARAIVMRPKILLADEPTGNLDQKNSDQVHEFLAELNREFDMTMVVVTHNPRLADYMERKMTIEDKRLVEVG